MSQPAEEIPGEARSEEQERRLQPRLYAVRTVAGREIDVALIMEQRARDQNMPIYAIIVPPQIKGYVIVETPAAFYATNAIQGIRYAKGVVPGVLRYEDVERLLKPKAVIETLKPGDIVEIISGPFRGMKGQVVRVSPSKNEVVLNVLEVEYPLQITVPGDSVRPSKEERGSR
ncbi:transcription elongation factor Spt5 [Hyperthermus butylicus]|uniref:Transcription elongation factor Spt5 n=1 Tax=Hyperthermus butylicus (strain DSM 5456 / JCM 9403 / PLM1-5) TaxID=415426 RepID=A2BN62_HYPBU|nr:transcription elongation factor Spt5 [Hyperthermus butylicus]ABM81423.1 transcription antiterminator [Hyperthermus butylicus DSM 5456]